jgi:hypothetical protein
MAKAPVYSVVKGKVTFVCPQDQLSFIYDLTAEKGKGAGSVGALSVDVDAPKRRTIYAQCPAGHTFAYIVES